MLAFIIVVRTWLSRLGSFPSLPHWSLSYRWWQKCTGAKVLVHLWLASVTSPCGLVCPPFSVVPRKSPNPELGITHKQFWYKAILPQRQEAPPGQQQSGKSQASCVLHTVMSRHTGRSRARISTNRKRPCLNLCAKTTSIFWSICHNRSNTSLNNVQMTASYLAWG